jgi:peptidoglycan/xylan/chitin deacetylase (PgdA/CDA1 family)
LRKKLKGILLSVVLCAQLILPSTTVEAAQTFYNNTTGNEDGYDYELWKDYGSTSMNINGGGKFDCWWENIGNALFRKGKKFDCTQTYQQIGNITIDYGVNYQPEGNSYLCVYGWTRDPLVEYYIVESWGTWRPPGATSKGTITVDGGTYDVYETTRVNQPSIDGDTTFQQYWSVRTSKRTSGTISVTEHFKAWENMGMKMGKLYEAALNVEGYQSSGYADVYQNDIKVGGTISSGSSSSGSSSSDNSNSAAPGTAQGTRVECEDMNISGQYAGTISSPFTGVALYANDESVSYTQNFTSGTHDFTLSGASDGSNMAKVDLVIGGENKGTFYFGDANHAEYTIKNVTHGTGNQKIELVVNDDDGNWDAYVDALIIGGSGVGSGDSGNTSGGTSGGTTSGGTTGGTTSGTTNTSDSMECENMTITGQYAGTISSPFSGVALYANDESCKYTQYFSNGTHNFTLRGCSDSSNMAKVDLKIGGETKGTFYFGDSYPAEYTIENVSHGTGNQTIELVVTSDDGNWDAYLDCLTISGTSTSTGTTTGGTSGATKMVALTFDDGPSTTTTPQVLDILEKYDVVATFFLIGQQVNSDTMSIMQRQIAMGCELGNHSYTHVDMSNLSATDIKNQIEWTSSAIKNTVGYDVKFFRPPYLGTSNTMYQNIDLAFIQGIGCNDWESSVSASQRANTVLSSVKDGSIVLLHDFQGNTNTVQALPTIIEGLKNQGYTFVTLSELFEAKGVNPNQEYKIWSNVYD